ncbi:MAG: amino acid racemase [Nitrospirota bacterium]
MNRKTGKQCYGIIGGLGALGCADIFSKLVKATHAYSDSDQFDIIFEQHPFEAIGITGGENANQTSRKMYVFNMIKVFEERKVDAIILPCFISHTFIDELKAETRLPIVDIVEAQKVHIQKKYPAAHRLGILTSNYSKKKALFEKYFTSPYELIYPRQQVQNECLMEAIYGPLGLRSGHLRGRSIELLYKSCCDLMDQGAEIIMPGLTEISIVVKSLRARGVPIIDANQVYAEYAIESEKNLPAKTFKIGIIGGVGPAATTDFMNKIIHHTHAKKDQEHIKMIVEHNPQIPDRTANLIGAGIDPTIALYSACKRLEADDADIITIPCNTAHAFVERIQPYLSIPIVNMLFETVEYIRQNFSDRKIIGLLATTGTVKSRVYHDMVAKTNFDLIIPDDDFQKKVMNAIYGEKGVKAGFTEGECKDDLNQALEHLVKRGAEVIILGCTELPLLQSENNDFHIGDRSVAILDPTAILARKCVALSAR